MKPNEENYLIFSEIINGYSAIKNHELGEVFIKHASNFELLKSEKHYFYSLKEAVDKNLPTNSKREKDIISQGFWTNREEEKIADTIKFIQGLRENISKEYLLSQRKRLRREVANAEKTLDSLLMKKDYLIGLTAEKYAKRQSIYYQITDSFYKNETLTEKFAPDELNDEEMYEKLCGIYECYNNRINIKTIRSIAISSFFMNLFIMCGDNAYFFYGKPIIQLTNFQSTLFTEGRYFKNLISQYGERIPKEMNDNPEDMMDFFEITHNVEKSGILKDDGSENVAATSLVGATKEDMILMGIDPSQIRSVSKDMAKLGKSMLNKEDLLKLRGM
jgi:hypothetical protein